MLAVGGTLAGILAAEVLLRFADIGYGNAPHEAHPILHHVHPRTYRFLSHGPTGEYGGHHIFYDERGLSSNPEPDEVDRSDCRIAFLGDSFTEAGQVAWKDSFVGILARSSPCDVRNYGVASYSPILYYLQWQHDVASWQPDIVVIQLFSNDISDDREYHRAALTDQRGLPVAIPSDDNPLVGLLRELYVARLIRKFQLQISWMVDHWGEDRNVVGGLVEEDPEISEFTSDIMDLLHREVRRSGATLVVFAVPSKFRLTNLDSGLSEPEFADLWRVWCRQRDIPYIDLVEPFHRAARTSKRLFFSEDIHFNELGHAVAAREIGALIRDLLHDHRDPASNENAASFSPAPRAARIYAERESVMAGGLGFSPVDERRPGERLRFWSQAMGPGRACAAGRCWRLPSA